MTAPGEGDAAMSLNSQSAVNNEGLKELSIKSSFPDGTQTFQSNDVAHLKNQVSSLNDKDSPTDSKPQIADINLPTPTDSAVDSSAHAFDSTAAVSEPHPDTATSVAAPNGTDSLSTSSAMETDQPTQPMSAPAVAPVAKDPAVQPPVSDSRDPVEPVSQAQAAEIQAEKVAADPISDGIATDAVGATATVGETPAEVIPAQAEPAQPAASSEAMDTSDDKTAQSTPPVDLPHHPASATNGEAAADQTPAVSALDEPKSTSVLDAPTNANTDTSFKAEAPAPVSTTLPPPSEDTEMKDAPPPSPGKMSRSREDDSGLDEPDAKRMRPSSAAGSIMAAGSPANAGSPASPAPTHRGDRDFTSPITDPQQRALAQVLANTKRSTHSGAFSKPVDPVALGIPTYPDIVKQPMDLGTMNEKIKKQEYPNVQAFVDDFNLVISNCEKFNGAHHQITQNAYRLRDTFEKQMFKMPSADYVEPPLPEKKSKKKETAPRQPARRESRVAAQPKTPVAASPTGAFALNPDGMPLIRRDSALDGRPRREIHPPAPKDLPYSARPKKKKYQVELRYCNMVLHELDKPKYNAFAHPFKFPVDPVALNIPNYHKVIKKPMDLQTMRKKIDNGMYENAKDFETDMRLIFQNCYKFNQAGDFVYNSGKQLEHEFDNEWAKKDDYIRQNAPDAGVQSASSPEPDSDEEEEAESEEEDNEQDKITQLQAQIAAMSQQLNTLTGKKGKKKSPPAPTKKKGSKKESKKVDKKADKKSKSKQAKSTPYVSYEQKQFISNSINTLPEARMMQALEIIKNNMPQLKGAENDELELDIDELSNEVLFKLLQFVRKYAPKQDNDADERRQSFAPAQPAKTKKNKPMNAKEQESRIEQLRRIASGDATNDNLGAAASSDDDDDDSDEESEED